MPSLLDYILVTLSGWLGLLLMLLVVWQVAELLFPIRRRLSSRTKILIAATLLAVGLVSAWRNRVLDIAAMEAELQRQRDASTPLHGLTKDELLRKTEPLRRDLRENPK
jgi:hypothetical protein